jgi:simple sugar transport system permease protein
MSESQIVDLVGLVLMASVPYILAAQGTMLPGRTGLFFVSQEAIMMVGASVGFLVSYHFGSLFLGVVAAMISGGIFGLVLAYFTTGLKMDQFVIGLATFFLGMGLASLLFKLFVGVTLTPPIIPTLKPVAIPLLSQIPIIGPILFNQNILVYFSILLSLFLYYFLYWTSWGMNLRAIGENPKAADSLGINVVKQTYIAAILGGMMMGLAGAYLPMVYTGTYTEGIVQGRGWLAIALTFFGGWSPHLILLGSLFFAGVEVLALRVQLGGMGIPHQFLRMLPYLATILVMIFAFRNVRPPAFLGLNYDRESRTGS